MPDNSKGFVPHSEIGEIVRLMAMVYCRSRLRNAPDIYPSGTHLESTVIALSRERVRRAEIGLDHPGHYHPEAATLWCGSPGLGILEIQV